MTLATKSNNKKKDINHAICYQCGQMGHYASKRHEKKKEKDMETSRVVKDYVTKFEQGFSLVSIDSNIGSSIF